MKNSCITNTHLTLAIAENLGASKVQSVSFTSGGNVAVKFSKAFGLQGQTGQSEKDGRLHSSMRVNCSFYRLFFVVFAACLTKKHNSVMKCKCIF